MRTASGTQVADKRNEIVIQPIFREAGLGAGAPGAWARRVPFVSEQSNNRGSRIQTENLLYRRDSGPGRQVKIHQDHVGPVFREALHCLGCGTN